VRLPGDIAWVLACGVSASALLLLATALLALRYR
jgi:hypothetical protein